MLFALHSHPSPPSCGTEQREGQNETKDGRRPLHLLRGYMSASFTYKGTGWGYWIRFLTQKHKIRLDFERQLKAFSMQMTWLFSC